MITIRGVSKRFGKQVVLDNINLDIEEGKTLAIVGPSGVGKSVLLKLIMGIMEPDSGEIVVFGQNMSAAGSEAERNEIRRSLGVLFQSAALFDSLNVYDNVAFALRERANLPEKQVHDRTVEMLDSLGLEDYALLFPEQISLGTRKRVGMARSLVLNPKVILFDEPNTGLDPLVGQEVYNLIKESQEKWGVSGVVISHELPEVFQVSDKVAMILGGNIIFEGTPKEFAESDNLAVQQFLNGKVDGPIKIQ
jgi:phospholipid/cholesterol/gamma-HCH transport system ATP-binding protein